MSILFLPWTPKRGQLLRHNFKLGLWRIFSVDWLHMEVLIEEVKDDLTQLSPRPLYLSTDVISLSTNGLLPSDWRLV